METHRLPVIAIVCTILILAICAQAQAQHVVQLSGLVTHDDSLTAAAGVGVFIPNTTRGTYTNQDGFFSLPVLPGDSVVIAALGYEKQYILIPKDFKNQSYTSTTTLKPTSIALPTVDVMPWATERDLRMAVARVKLPKQVTGEINLELIIKKAEKAAYPMDAGANTKHGLQQQNRQMQGRYMVPSDVKLFSIPIRYK